MVKINFSVVVSQIETQRKNLFPVSSHVQAHKKETETFQRKDSWLRKNYDSYKQSLFMLCLTKTWETSEYA